MKRFVINILLLAMFLLVGCETYTEGYSRSEMIVVSTENIELPYEGGAVEVDIKSLCSWNVTSDEGWSWAHSSLKCGEKGSTKVELTFDENRKTQKRESIVAIGNDKYDVSHEIVIQQEAFEPQITAEYYELSVIHSGATKIVRIDSNVTWEVSCESEWITVTPTTGNLGQTELAITIAPNAKIESRTAKIDIYSEEYDIKKAIKVNQEAFDMQFSVSESEINAAFEGEVLQLSVSSNVAWEAVCEADWVTMSPSKGVVGVSNMDVTIAPNAKTKARTAILKILCADSGYTKEIVITQAEFKPNIAAPNVTLSADGGTDTITVSSNVSWTASCDADWVKLQTTSGDAPNADIVVEISPNTATSSRNASIVLYNEEYNYAKSIDVEQSAFSPQINTVSSVTMNSDGGTSTITIDSNVSWTASCDADWVKLQTTSGDAPSADIVVEISPNAATTSRNASIVLYNEKYNYTKSINVRQSAFSPRLNISSSRIILSTDGAANTITIDSNMSLNVRCNASWLTLSSTQVKPGTSKLAISANTNNAKERRASIEIYNSDCGISRAIVVTQQSIPNAIWYRPYYNYLIYPLTGAIDANIISNSQNSDDSECMIVFDAPITRLGSRAFASSRIATITLPSSVTSIGDEAFSSCNYLSSITIHQGITSIGSRAFYLCHGELIIDNPNFVNKSWLDGSEFSSLTIGDNVSKIGEGSFRNFSSLTRLTIGDSVTSIGASAFYGCDYLIWVTIGNGVTSIGDSAFYGCNGMRDVTIPNSVTSIGSGAFAGCSGLNKIYCKAKTPPKGNSNMFDRITTIYVPRASVDAYKRASYWSDYASQIVGYDF